jgi:hypothetical protein
MPAITAAGAKRSSAIADLGGDESLKRRCDPSSPIDTDQPLAPWVCDNCAVHTLLRPTTLWALNDDDNGNHDDDEDSTHDHFHEVRWCYACVKATKCGGCTRAFQPADRIALANVRGREPMWCHDENARDRSCWYLCDECGGNVPTALTHSTSTKSDLGDGIAPNFDDERDDYDAAARPNRFRVCGDCVEACVLCNAPVNGDASALEAEVTTDGSDTPAVNCHAHLLCTRRAQAEATATQ